MFVCDKYHLKINKRGAKKKKKKTKNKQNKTNKHEKEKRLVFLTGWLVSKKGYSVCLLHVSKRKIDAQPQHLLH